MYKFTCSSYFWNHSSELDTLVNQNSHAAPIRSPVRGRTGFSKSRGLRASVTFFPLPQPTPSTFLLSPHFSHGPNAKTSFARPEFRSHRSGTLATQAMHISELSTSAFGLGGSYPPLPPLLSALVDNTLLDLQNSSYPTQPHSIIAKY